MYLIFDTETTGLPKDWKKPYTDTDNWPRAIQIAWQLHDEMGELVEAKDYIIQPIGFDIPYDAERIHGISTEYAMHDGVTLERAMAEFQEALAKSKFIVGQNVGFDKNIVGCEFHRLGLGNEWQNLPVLDTCTEVTATMCKLPGGRGGRFKLPTLSELHTELFNEPFAEAHNATADVEATTRCFFELVRREVFTPEELKQELTYFNRFREYNPTAIQPVGLQHVNLKEASAALKAESQTDASNVSTGGKKDTSHLKDVPFVHLHNHSQYSILQSTITIGGLVQKTIEHGMNAVALTDIGNMMAAFHFEKAISGHNKKIKEERKEAEEAGLEFTKKEIIPLLEKYLGTASIDSKIQDLIKKQTPEIPRNSRYLARTKASSPPLR